MLDIEQTWHKYPGWFAEQPRRVQLDLLAKREADQIRIAKARARQARADRLAMRMRRGTT